jgi:hypothetical protein
MTEWPSILLPRQADHLYWMSRYLERALCRATLIPELQALIGPAKPIWEALPAAFEDGAAYRTAKKKHPRITVPQFYGQSALHGVPGMIEAARNNARSVRSVLPESVWEQINRLYLMTKDASGGGDPASDPDSAFVAVRLNLLMFGGLVERTLPHDDRFIFYRLGQALERAEQTIGLCSLALPDDEMLTQTWYRHLARLLGGSPHQGRVAEPTADLLGSLTGPASPVSNLAQVGEWLRRLPCLALADQCVGAAPPRQGTVAVWLAAQQRRLDLVHQGILDFIEGRTTNDDDLRHTA